MMTLSEIVKQLESCNFECEGGSLSMNTAFIELKEHAELEDAIMVFAKHFDKPVGAKSKWAERIEQLQKQMDHESDSNTSQ